MVARFREKELLPSALCLGHSSWRLEVTCDGVATQGSPLCLQSHASPAGSKASNVMVTLPTPWPGGGGGGSPLFVLRSQPWASLGFSPRPASADPKFT